MPSKLRKNTLPNIPNLMEFIDTNHTLFHAHWDHVLSNENKVILSSIVAIASELRIEMIKTLNAKSNREERDHYLVRSLNLFYTNINAAIERLLQCHVSFSLMHCRVSIETAIILYIHHKGRVAFEDIVQNKVNIYTKAMVHEFEKEYKKGEQGKYPMLFPQTLEFLEMTCMNGIHPNYGHVNHLSIQDKKTAKIQDWTHYPLSNESLNKLITTIYINIMPCLCMYVDVFAQDMEESVGSAIVAKTLDLQGMMNKHLAATSPMPES